MQKLERKATRNKGKELQIVHPSEGVTTALSANPVLRPVGLLYSDPRVCERLSLHGIGGSAFPPGSGDAEDERLTSDRKTCSSDICSDGSPDSPKSISRNKNKCMVHLPPKLVLVRNIRWDWRSERVGPGAVDD